MLSKRLWGDLYKELLQIILYKWLQLNRASSYVHWQRRQSHSRHKQAINTISDLLYHETKLCCWSILSHHYLTTFSNQVLKRPCVELGWIHIVLNAQFIFTSLPMAILTWWKTYRGTTSRHSIWSLLLCMLTSVAVNTATQKKHCWYLYRYCWHYVKMFTSLMFMKLHLVTLNAIPSHKIQCN